MELSVTAADTAQRPSISQQITEVLKIQRGKVQDWKMTHRMRGFLWMSADNR